MAIHYHIESNDFVFDHPDSRMPWVVKGYLFTLQRSAHTTCNCFQGIGFNVFRPHSEEDGKFPDHTVLDQAMAMPDFTVHRYAHGWVRRSALQRVFDPTILLSSHCE